MSYSSPFRSFSSKSVVAVVFASSSFLYLSISDRRQPYTLSCSCSHLQPPSPSQISPPPSASPCHLRRRTRLGKCSIGDEGVLTSKQLGNLDSFCPQPAIDKTKPVAQSKRFCGTPEEEFRKTTMESLIKESLPFLVMMVVESVEVGLITLSKAAMSRGMSNFIFVVYYNALGTLFLLPSFSFHFFSRKRPPITFALLCRFFLLGSIGICFLQIFAYAGINYSSPTLGAAIGNLIPAFTFLLAVCLGMEKLDLRKCTSQAKSLGTVVAICGASVMTLYKGPPLLTATESLHSNRDLPLLAQKSNWALGGLLLIVTSLFSSTWNILQTATANEYPDQVIIVFFFTLFGTIQSGFGCFFLERNPEAWKIHNKLEIIAIVYGALAVTVFRNTVVTWCLHKKGPVYVAMYKPLSIIIAAFMAYVFLGDSIYLGSVIGAATIAAGFYAVIWGQAKEKDTALVNGVTSVESICNPKAPLLQTSLA